MEISDESCEKLATTVQSEISKSSPQFSDDQCCIYRVPPLLRRRNEQAYTPVVVSIGPLHHNDKRLLPMKSHKLSYLQSFLRNSPTNMDLSFYLTFVKARETDIRRCYADPIHLSSDDFIQMVLIDSVFIIELFRRRYNKSLIEDDDFIYARSFMSEDVERDIMLEENQVPFFFLNHLYQTAFKPHRQAPSFTDLACRFLKLNIIKIDYKTPYFHLLDLLRSHYKPSETRTNGDKDRHPVSIPDINSHVCPAVTSLFAAGVKFQPVSPDISSSNLLDIRFDKTGILKIPILEVNDKTECLFRNLIAFEQCHYYPDDRYFSDYQLFLDWLINTPKDVQLLAKVGIIENWLGSDKQVSDLINSLGNNISISMESNDYKDTTEQLINYHKKKWNR